VVVPHVQLSLGGAPRIVLAGAGQHGADESSHTYRIPRLWCLHLYDYDGEIRIGDWQGSISKGGVSLVPPARELTHRWFKPGSSHWYFLFRPDGPPSSAREFPVFLPTVGARCRQYLQEAAERAHSDPLHATAAFWHALVELASVAAGRCMASETPERMPAILAFIDQHLAEPLPLAEVARQFGLSVNHLNRIFKSATGRTVAAYWCQRRVERACLLLEHTSMGVKAAAIECGFTDLQQFNKLVRRHRGVSPRQVRLSRKGPK
jgi:AraC family transcriptional regulator